MFFTAFHLCILRLFKFKTESQTTYRKACCKVIKLKSSCSSWVSLICFLFYPASIDWLVNSPCWTPHNYYLMLVKKNYFWSVMKIISFCSTVTITYMYWHYFVCCWDHITQWWLKQLFMHQGQNVQSQIKPIHD